MIKSLIKFILPQFLQAYAMQFKKITDIKLQDKIVFIRTDMNAPIQNNQITDDTRIQAGLSTINYCLEHGAKVILATHLGRPIEGKCSSADSVQLIANRLGELLQRQIPVIKNFSGEIDFTATNLVMLENVRCNLGEKKNSDGLGQQYAALCDVFVHDAFATAHRAEASTDAVGKYAKEVCAGLLMSQELTALAKVVANPTRPVIAIVAGSKVSTKLTILNNLADKVDCLIVGGGILNTFLVASGVKVGKSLVEIELVDQAKQIMTKMQQRNAMVPLPQDVIVASELSATAPASEKQLDQIQAEDMILDIGSNFAIKLAQIIANAGTIIWNGPVGVFEFAQFARGTETIATSIANSQAFSLAGGGDTIAAINKFGLWNKISYVSTAGGALLEFLE
ncbi:MAG: phosphoglycerate kinase, partial [Burkholderiales bacterium]